uniref:Uncharacterized protein n=1 Tax=Candidatus Kentrum sp. SD TaxID=2126332 RepID=A0A450YYV9_9GAMM|nr:MAG: hypothetical protein BECKSD772F_GA0070984_108111 [Candidatus Kentron sp. SD]VFK46725.1 MAG: hypothetical protein BECKSD772E_GA0070983_107911 [Candidatus Kentron sp. SD]VFK78430.1 MAG: hypothetical protein BECKSD772D_GA0070982_10154 [Candidatus Kentron sp. SD]
MYRTWWRVVKFLFFDTFQNQGCQPRDERNSFYFGVFDDDARAVFGIE